MSDTTSPEPCAAITELRTIANDLADQAHSDSTRRKLNWICAEWSSAVTQGLLPEGVCAELRRLLSPESTDAYLAAAEAGHLRRNARGRWSGGRTHRDRITTVNKLCHAAGLPVHAHPGHVHTITPMTEAQWHTVWAHVNALPPPGDTTRCREELIRTAAAMATIHDTGMSITQLAALTADQLAALPLSPAGRTAVDRWLTLRQHIVSRLAGGQVHAAWIVVRSGGPVVAGLPVSAYSLRKSHSKTVRAVNWAMAGQPDWEPCPTKPEQLRRGFENRTRAPDPSGAALPAQDPATAA